MVERGYEQFDYNSCFQPAYSITSETEILQWAVYVLPLLALSLFSPDIFSFKQMKLFSILLIFAGCGLSPKVCPSDQTAFLPSLSFQILSTLQEPVFTSNNQLEDKMLFIITPKLLATT